MGVSAVVVGTAGTPSSLVMAEDGGTPSSSGMIWIRLPLWGTFSFCSSAINAARPEETGESVRSREFSCWDRERGSGDRLREVARVIRRFASLMVDLRSVDFLSTCG